MAGDDAAPDVLRQQWADGNHGDSKYRFICVLGGPGSGRGTHCRKLTQELGVAHCSAGSLLRRAVESDHRAAGDIEGAMAGGEPVADPLVFSLVQSAFKEATRYDKDRVVLLDGFPRDSEQTRWMQRTLGEPELVVFLDCPHHVMVERVTQRDTRLDPNRSGDNNDTTELYRVDNTEAAAHTLIHRFNVDTLPIMDVFGSKVQIVPTETSLEQAYRDVLVCVGGRVKGPGSPKASPVVREVVASPTKDAAAAAAECATAALDELIKLPPDQVAPLLINFVDSADAFLRSQQPAEAAAETTPPRVSFDAPAVSAPLPPALAAPPPVVEEATHEELSKAAVSIQTRRCSKNAREELADEMRLARARAAVELSNARIKHQEDAEADKHQREREHLEQLEIKKQEQAERTAKLESVLKSCEMERFLPSFLKAKVGIEKLVGWDPEKMGRKLGLTRVGLSSSDIEDLVKALVQAGYSPVSAASFGFDLPALDRDQPAVVVVADAEVAAGVGGSEYQKGIEWVPKLRGLLQDDRLTIIRTGDPYHGLKLFRLDREVTYTCTDTDQQVTSMLVAVELSTDRLLSNTGYASLVGGRSPNKFSPGPSATAGARKKYNGIPEVPPELEGGLFEAKFVAGKSTQAILTAT